jgi:hypothetical protein
MLQGGYLQFGAHPRIRLHLALPLGALAAGRFALSPGAWAGYTLVLVLRATAQAAASAAMGAGVGAIEVHPLGTRCRPRLATTRLAAAAIAWSGLAAQAAVLFAALAARSAPLAQSPFWGELVGALIWPNVALLAVNLLPLAPLDGGRAYRLREETRSARARASVAEGPAPEPLAAEPIASGRPGPPDGPPSGHSSSPIRTASDPPPHPLDLAALTSGRGRPAGARLGGTAPRSAPPLPPPVGRFAVEDEDEVLPPLPDDLRREMLRIIEEATSEGAGRNKRG